MAGFNIDAYRASFQGGARQYLFYYKPNFPTGIPSINVGAIDMATYMVRSTTIPETTTEEITLNWQGFDFKVAGKYTYNDWTVTFNVDLDNKIQALFANWASLIHDPTSNTYKRPASYFTDQQIDLCDLNGNVITKYRLIGAWPKSIGQATLDYSANEVVQFDVTFAYMYHTVSTAKYAAPPTYT